MANAKPSCGKAVVGVLVILFGITFAIWLVAEPRAEKEPEPNWIIEGRDGNHATICAAVFYRVAFHFAARGEQYDDEAARAFLILGSGDKARAISLARSSRPILGEGSCANETITDEFHAAERAVREGRTEGS